MSDGPSDDLLARLRARAQDPARRTEVRPSQFDVATRTLGHPELLLSLQQAQADLARSTAASRAGHVDPDAHARAEQLGRAMTAPAGRELPPPADQTAIQAAEAELGIALPPFRRRLCAEVADGAFGPGEGLLPLARLVAAYVDLRRAASLPRGRAWPERFLPVIERDSGWDCVDASSGRVVVWDSEGLSERSGEVVFRSSFREIAASVEQWLAG